MTTNDQPDFLKMQAGHSSTLLSAGQRGALNSLVSNFTKKRPVRLALISALIGRHIETTNDVTLEEWQMIRDLAYPGWRETPNGWPGIDPKFEGFADDVVKMIEETRNG